MNICVYGASSNKIDQKYVTATEQLGRLMAERGHTLIYGGGSGGMMGAAARGMYGAGGTIIGVAPTFFIEQGVLYEHCTDFIYTETMRERKQIMEDRSDAFIMSPGGIGTFEEFFEILTLRQLRRHNKPIAVFNVGGYYDGLISFLDSAIEKGFMTPACRKLFGTFDDAATMLDYIEHYTDDTASDTLR